MQLNDENISGFEGGGQLKIQPPPFPLFKRRAAESQRFYSKEKAEHTVSLCFSVASKIELNKLNH